MDRIALLNFGGIGDEILFSPVIDAVKKAYPTAHLTLILETRSQSIRDLLPQINNMIGIDLDKLSRPKLFGHLLKILKNGRFDAIISSGSSPFIALLLWASGIPSRTGFDTGWLSRLCLTHPAPLNRHIYAGDMYFSLAQAFLNTSQGDAVPNLNVPVSNKLFQSQPKQRILIHPGVSRMSVEKNILKAWPMTHWTELIRQLPLRYPEAHIYLLGGPDDAEAIAGLEAARQQLAPDIRQRVINLYGESKSFLDLAVIIAEGSVLISVDSAPLHLAIGLDTPVVAIFGPTDEVKLVPKTANAVVCTREDLACRPCLWDVRQTSCDTPLCLDIPVELVLQNLTRVLRP